MGFINSRALLRPGRSVAGEQVERQAAVDFGDFVQNADIRARQSLIDSLLIRAKLALQRNIGPRVRPLLSPEALESPTRRKLASKGRVHRPGVEAARFVCSLSPEGRRLVCRRRIGRSRLIAEARVRGGQASASREGSIPQACGQSATASRQAVFRQRARDGRPRASEGP
jgi:hypothetical protein